MRVRLESTSEFAATAAGERFRGLLAAVEASELPGKRVNAAKLSGLRGAAAIVRKEARRIVPVRTGELKRSIAVTVERRIQEAQLKVRAPHWHIIEFGRSPGTAASGRDYGGAPPHPFILPAFQKTVDMQLDGAVKAMQRYLGRLGRIK